MVTSDLTIITSPCFPCIRGYTILKTNLLYFIMKR